MIQTTYSGQTLFLLNQAPSWSTPIETKFAIPNNVEEALDGGEVRRKVGESLRVSVNFSIVAEGAKARALESGLRAHMGQPVACPLWPFVTEWGQRASRKITGGLSIVFRRDLSAWEIFEAVEPGWPVSGDLVLPLLVGKLTRRDLEWISTNVVRFAVDFDEQSKIEWALQLSAQEWTTGPTPSAAWPAAPVLFPAAVDFDGAGQSYSLNIERDGIGFGRVPVETVYQPTTIGEGDADFYAANQAEAARLIAFFAQHGHGKAFWLRLFSAGVELVEDVAPLAFHMLVQDAGSIIPGDWVSFTSGDVDRFAKVAAISGSVLDIGTPVGFVSARQTLVSRLRLCRFKRSELSLKWDCADVARCTIPVRELPGEVDHGEWDTLGDTDGELPARIFLYEFAQTVGGVTTYERLTSFEEDVEDDDGRVFTASRTTHGAINSTDKLERNGVEVTVALPDSSIIRAATRLTSPAPITVKIWEASAERVRSFDSGHSIEEYQ